MDARKIRPRPLIDEQENKMNKINIELLKKFIEGSHRDCKFCNLKDTICVGKNCSEEIFKSLLVKNNSELKNDS